MNTAFDLVRLQKLQEAFRDARDATDYALAPRVAGPLQRAVEESPFYGRIADAGKLIVRTIHGVQDLYEKAEPGDFEFYLGRCGATEGHVYGRFDNHVDNRLHEGGIVVLRCATADVTTWEGAAIRSLNGLHRRGRLCVANVLCHGGGGLPRSLKESAIYLTWRILPRTAFITPAVRRDVGSIAEDVSDAMNGVISRDSDGRALDPITRPTMGQAPVVWARGHRS